MGSQAAIMPSVIPGTTSNTAICGRRPNQYRMSAVKLAMPRKEHVCSRPFRATPGFPPSRHIPALDKLHTCLLHTDRFLKLIGQVQNLLFWPPSRVPRRYGPLGHTQPGLWYFTTPSNLFICRSTTFFAPPTSERPSSRQLVQEFAGTLKIQPAPTFDSILWWRLMDWKSVRV